MSSTKTKTLAVKKPAVNKTRVIKTKAPAKANVGTMVVKLESIPATIKRGKGRPSGTKSYTPVLLSDLNRLLKETATVLVDTKFAKALTMEAAPMPIAGCEGITVKEESDLKPRVETFESEESAAPSNGILEISEIK